VAIRIPTDEQVDKFKFREENERAKAKAQASTGRPLLSDYQASLATDRSSQPHRSRRRRVLTEASIRGAVDTSAPEGKRDHGRLIPAGTGLEFYRNFSCSRKPRPPQAEALRGEVVIPTSPAPAGSGLGRRRRGKNTVKQQ